MKNFQWIILILILVGCSSYSRTETVPIISLPSRTSSYTPDTTATTTATETIAPVITKVPYSPISTPSSNENTEITLELLQTNNHCNLPCWWGIIPNQTTWKDAEKFLKPFSTIYERQPPSEWFVYDVHSPLSIEFSEVNAVRAVYAVQHGVVKEIETGYFDEESYHIPGFLSRVGQPSDILVLTYSSDYGMPRGKVPFLIALYYPEQGIMATYAADADVKSSVIDVCIRTSPSLFLWSPTEATRSIDYILGWDKRDEKYLELEDATELSISEFYETYSKSNASVCLQTPTSLWPSQ